MLFCALRRVTTTRTTRVFALSIAGISTKYINVALLTPEPGNPSSLRVVTFSPLLNDSNVYCSYSSVYKRYVAYENSFVVENKQLPRTDDWATVEMVHAAFAQLAEAVRKVPARPRLRKAAVELTDAAVQRVKKLLENRHKVSYETCAVRPSSRCCCAPDLCLSLPLHLPL